MLCTEKSEELNYKQDLIDLVVEFIKLLDCLLDKGKITSEQYEELIKCKVDFLKQCN